MSFITAAREIALSAFDRATDSFADPYEIIAVLRPQFEFELYFAYFGNEPAEHDFDESNDCKEGGAINE
jgi:hypothetical protein